MTSMCPLCYVEVSIEHIDDHRAWHARHDHHGVDCTHVLRPPWARLADNSDCDCIAFTWRVEAGVQF